LVLFNFVRFFFSFFRIFFVFINYFFYVVYYLFFGYFRLEENAEGEAYFFTRPEPYHHTFNFENQGFNSIPLSINYGEMKRQGERYNLYKPGSDILVIFDHFFLNLNLIIFLIMLVMNFIFFC
jgi:hypothetical protein